MAQTMEVSPQAEEYLEAVCRILDRGETATPSELGRELRVAPPSAVGMLKRLEEQGLVDYSRRTGAQLTERGQHAALTLRRRHRLAERLLTDLLHIPLSRAHEIACRFEHVIDDEVEEYLSSALRFPSTCPHGNPIDGGHASALRPLSALQPDESSCVRCILDETVPMLEYLADLGLEPGVQVKMCAQAPFDGPLTIEVVGIRHALSRAMADHLLVDQKEVTV
ncbi:MAG: metal-dependent transcriptional regulator [Armatimonadota bacterium]